MRRTSAGNGFGEARVTTLLSLALSLLYIFVTPPFQTPDEPAHFVRALSLARGEPAAVAGPVGGGSWIPGDAARLIREWIRLAPGLHQKEHYDRGHFERSRAIERSAASTFIPKAAARQPSRINSNATAYLPIAHAIPAAVAVVCHLIDAPILVTFYLMRLANALIASILVGLAVAISPCYRWALAMVALLPMMISLRASLSPDSLVLAAGLVAVALIWRIGTDGFTAAGFAALLLTSALITSVKIPYVVVPLLYLMVPTLRFPSAKVRVLSILLLASILATSCAASLWWVGHGVSAPSTTIETRKGPQAVLADPGEFVIRAADTFTRNGGQYLAEVVGKLGWLNVHLPQGIPLAVLVVLALVSLFSPGAGLPSLMRWTAPLLAGAGVTLVCLALYAYAPVDRAGIDGLQGRYFLPFLPLVLPILRAPSLIDTKGRRAAFATVATILVVNAVALFLVARTFY